MKKISNSDQDDCLKNLQIELPLDISPTSAVFTPHPTWDLLENTADPYWDELEQEQSEEIAAGLLYMPTAPTKPQFVQEQFFVDNNELGIFNHPWDGTLAPEQDDTVRAQVSLATQKSAPEHSKPAHWVEKYWVKRGENKYWYYRYRWMFGRKSYRVHLGSVLSPLVKEKVEMVRGAIAAGLSTPEIQKMISETSVREVR